MLVIILFRKYMYTIFVDWLPCSWSVAGGHGSLRRRGYVAHVPFPLVESWQRSDSDPVLLDRNPPVESTRSQTNSPVRFSCYMYMHTKLHVLIFGDM